MKALKHFITITRHRHAVIRHCFRAGIGFQGLFHDLSKYSPTEFLSGAKYYQGTRSPNDMQRETFGYSAAWLHHKGRNKHHFEFWTDYDPVTHIVGPVKMPMKYVIEMFCDRVAACKIYKGENYNDDSALDYFMNAKKRRIIHPETSDFLEQLLRMLAEKGEDETFAYIKKLVKNKKDY